MRSALFLNGTYQRSRIVCGIIFQRENNVENYSLSIEIARTNRSIVIEDDDKRTNETGAIRGIFLQKSALNIPKVCYGVRHFIYIQCSISKRLSFNIQCLVHNAYYAKSDAVSVSPYRFVNVAESRLSVFFEGSFYIGKFQFSNRKINCHTTKVCACCEGLVKLSIVFSVKSPVWWARVRCCGGRWRWQFPLHCI